MYIKEGHKPDAGCVLRCVQGNSVGEKVNNKKIQKRELIEDSIKEELICWSWCSKQDIYGSSDGSESTFYQRRVILAEKTVNRF